MSDSESLDSGGKDAHADADADAGPKQYTGPVMISKKSDSAYEAEEQLAVAPDGTIAALWNSATFNAGPRLGYAFSTDGGATFTPPKYINVPKSGLAATDPSITVDAQGNFYASILGVHYDPSGTVDDAHVYVAKAPKGVTSFDTLVEATDPTLGDFYDHPKIMITGSGTILVGFMDFSAGATVARSTDGVNWQRSTLDAFGNLVWLCAANGTVYLTFFGSGIELRTSQDEGATWSANSSYVALPTESVAFMDPTCIAQGNEVWVSYGTSGGSVPGESTLDPAATLTVAHSTDKGATFPTRVNALDSAAGSLAVHAVLAREASGTIDIAYIAGAAEMDPKASLRLARMTGPSFLPSTSVDSPIVFQMDRSAANWLGDYMGMVAQGGFIYFAYPKNTTTLSHVWFAKVPLN